MNIIVGRPPNYEQILAVFPKAARMDVIFTYGWTIYSPGGPHVSDALIEHERVHAKRQNDAGVVVWWDKYLVDPAFRLAEELPAHRAEYQWHKHHSRDRNLIARHLHAIASRLAGPLYNNVIGLGQAKKLIIAT